MIVDGAFLVQEHVFFLHLLSTYLVTMQLLRLTFILSVLKLSVGNGVYAFISYKAHFH